MTWQPFVLWGFLTMMVFLAALPAVCPKQSQAAIYHHALTSEFVPKDEESVGSDSEPACQMRQSSTLEV